MKSAGAGAGEGIPDPARRLALLLLPGHPAAAAAGVWVECVGGVSAGSLLAGQAAALAGGRLPHLSQGALGWHAVDLHVQLTDLLVTPARGEAAARHQDGHQAGGGGGGQAALLGGPAPAAAPPRHHVRRAGGDTHQTTD